MLEIEQFNHVTVCQQMTHVNRIISDTSQYLGLYYCIQVNVWFWRELLVLNDSTCYSLTVCQDWSIDIA